MILDMMLPDRSGLDIIEEHEGAVRRCAASSWSPRTTTWRRTIRAMKLGAFDYIHKPFSDPAALDLVVHRALSVRQLSPPRRERRPRRPRAARLGDIVGNSPVMQQLVKEIGKVAAAPRATVLITGESGTGKELIARVIHNYSYDEPRPFIGINCSAIVDTLLESELFGHEKGAFTGASATKPGKFEVAEDGTVFLDEIGDMSLHAAGEALARPPGARVRAGGRGQAHRSSRARVIAATHRDLAEEVAAGRFREDLYQRLKVITLERAAAARAPRGHPPAGEAPARAHQREGPQAGDPRPARGAGAPGPAALAGQRARAGERAHPRGGARPRRGAARPRPARPGRRQATGRTPASAPCGSRRGRRQPDSHPGGGRAQLIERALAVTRGHKGRTCQMLGISRPTLERKLAEVRGCTLRQKPRSEEVSASLNIVVRQQTPALLIERFVQFDQDCLNVSFQVPGKRGLHRDCALSTRHSRICSDIERLPPAWHGPWKRHASWHRAIAALHCLAERPPTMHGFNRPLGPIGSNVVAPLQTTSSGMMVTAEQAGARPGGHRLQGLLQGRDLPAQLGHLPAGGHDATGCTCSRPAACA